MAMRAHMAIAAANAVRKSVAVAVPSTAPLNASVAWPTGLALAIVLIQPGMVSSGAKALDTNISGIITIIPANWTTSGRRSRSPMLRKEPAARRRPPPPAASGGPGRGSGGLAPYARLPYRPGR